MVEVYFYVPAEEAENAVECGLKLSIWCSKEVTISNSRKKCISALFNPKDDMDKYRSENYRCLKLQLEPGYCFAADKYLYEVGLEIPEVMELYNATVIPAVNYIFGSYRLPECLVSTTVIGGNIGVLNKKLDSPVLFDNSEELYINGIMETNKEENANFLDEVLYYYFDNLARNGTLGKFQDAGKTIAVFSDKNSGKTYTFKIPKTEYVELVPDLAEGSEE